MRKISLALGLALLALQAVAANFQLMGDSNGLNGFQHYYFQVGGGYSAQATNVVRNKGNDSTVYDTFGGGYTANLAAGYRFNKNFRLGLQETYIRNKLSEIKFTGTSGHNKSNKDYSEGWVTALNGYYDFANSTHFTPYIGVGPTYSWLKTDFSNVDKATYWAPGWDGIVGLDYTINTHFLVGANFTYIYTFPNNNINFGGSHYSNWGFTRYLFNVALTYRF